jgi:diaminobutyrate-2-oxoglutarate transaminase
MNIINRMEAEVRTYCRSFPAVFERAVGATLYTRDGRAYVDFFAGAGALNYGHNHPMLRAALLDYLESGGIVHSLDMATEAKLCFLEALEHRILRPRDLVYKAMFPGPTGTNAVEAALKLARKVTGRTQIVSFTNAFHGMTLGALAATGNAVKRSGAGVPLGHVIRAPFAGYFGPGLNTLDQIRTLLDDTSSGVDAPAAFLVETIQAEGGVNVANAAWLQGLAQLARDVGALMIIDDIQVGCGRTGAFFSFEEAGLQPDIVCLSKSLSAFGLPFAMMLLRPEHDVFAPGEHNGTFRGNNLAFVTATAAFEHFWRDDHFSGEIERKCEIAQARLRRIAGSEAAEVRGKGLILGLELEHPSLARLAAARAFELGLVIETAGAENQVLKILPPLTIGADELARGLDLLDEAIGFARRELSRDAPAAESRGVVAAEARP